MTREAKSGRNYRPTALFEAVEARRMFSGTPGGFSILQSINVDRGMYIPGHRLGAQVSLYPYTPGLDGLPVTLALSKDGIVGNEDDIILGTSEATTASWNSTILAANFDVALPASLADGTYQVVASSDDGSQLVGYSINVATPKPGADLAFDNASMPPWLWPEYQGGVNTEVRNDGTVNSGPWTMDVYLSKDKILGNADDILVWSGSPMGSGAGIDGGDTRYAGGNFDRPSMNIPDGIYYPIFVIDPQNQVAETDETNNVLVANPIIAGPHFAQAGVESVQAASRTDAGSTLSVDVTTKAMPGMDPRDLYFELLAADGTIYRLGGGLTLPTAGGHVDLTVPADVPAGQYQLRTMVDIDGMTCMIEVEDRDPATVGPTVWVGMDPPTAAPETAAPETTAPETATDVPAASPEAKPIKMVAGSSGEVPLVVSNDQKHAVRRDYNVTFYLSDDPTLSRDDRKFSKARVSAKVGGGQSNTIVASYSLPKGVRLGTQYLIAVADPVGGPAGGSAAKALRAGGTAGRVRLVVPVSVVGPQLAASVLAVRPVRGQPGMERLTVRLTNTGSAMFSDAVTLRVLSDSDSPETVLSVKKALNLKGGKHVDITLTVRRPVSGGVQVVVS